MSAQQTITIKMTREKAEDISFGLSDQICWLNGYFSARSEDSSGHDPMGLERLRDMNIALKKALGDNQ